MIKPYTGPRTAFTVALFTAITFILLFVYLGFNQRNLAYNDSKLLAQEISRKAAIETEQYFVSALMTAKAVRQSSIAIRNLKGDRGEIRKLLKDALSENSNFLAVWTLWEPNAFDGKDALYTKDSLYNKQGAMCFSYFKQNDTVYNEIMTPADYLGLYYTAPKNSKKEIITEPYYYIYSGYKHLFFGVTVSVPIIIDEKFLGVIGIDIDLTNLKKNLNKTRPYKTGFLSLITNSGVVVTHIDSSIIGKNAFKVNEYVNPLAQSSILKGEEHSVEGISRLNSNKVFNFFYPIRISQNIEPWSMMVEIPVKQASSRSSQLSAVALGILCVGLLLVVFLIFNILDRKRYDLALHSAIKEIEQSNAIADENAKKYQEIFNSTGEAIFIHDAQTGNILDVNNAMLQMYGYEHKAEVLANGLSVVTSSLADSNIDDASAYIKKAIEEGPQVFDWLAHKKSGEQFWVEISLRNSNILGKNRILAVVRDISERRNAQLTILQSEKKFRELAELLPQVVWEADMNTRFTYANQQGIALFGYSQEEFNNGIKIIDIIAPECRSKAVDNIKSQIQGHPVNGIEYLGLKKDGTRFPIQIFASAIYSNGKPIGLRGITIDISERKLIEKALVDSEEKYRTLMENVNEVILMTDNDNRILFVNKRFTEKLGYTPEEVIGKIGHEFLLPPEEKEKIVAVNKERLLKKTSQYEAVFIAKNGNEITFLVSGAPRLDSNGKIIGSIGAMMDISKRRKAEKELYASQQLFETLAQMSPVGIFRTRPNGYTTYVNPKWCQLSGLSADKALGNGWYIAVHPDDIVKVASGWKTKTELSEKSIAEYRFLRPDGSTVWVLGNALPEITDGVVTGYIGTITDITELKTTQNALTKSEKRYREMANLLPQIVWEADASGILTFSNNNGLELLGYSQEEFDRGINILSLIIPEERVRAVQNLQSTILTGKGMGEEYTALRKDGTTFPAQIFTSSAVENNRVTGIRGITIDISEAKKAAQELKESEERYRTIIESFPDIIMISDRQGQIIFANESFESTLGITIDAYNAPGCKVRIHTDDDALIKNEIWDLLNGHRFHSNTIDFRFIDASGEIHWFSGIVSKLILNKTIHLQIILRDITDKKHIENELEKHRSNLEQLVRERTSELEIALSNLQDAQEKLIQAEKMASLGVLAAGIAHEINNPLNFIQGGISGLKSYIYEALPEHIEETEPLIDAIQEGIRRSAEIVQSLNKYSRKNDLPRAVYSINSIIDSCLVMVYNQTKNRIAIEKNYCTNSSIVCNEGQIHQAFLNIIINAIQAIKNKGIIKIATLQENNCCKVIVVDNGCGISKNDMAKITDPFFTTKDPGKGTGLGLSITYNIIAEHKGSINFESEIGNGTTVTVTLPQK